MIPNLQEIARRLGVGPLFVPFAAAGVLTAFVLLAEAIANWFHDRDS